MAIWAGVISAAAASSARGQGPGGSRSLGGFGGTSMSANSEMGAVGPMIIPYGGAFEGFMPGRMGGVSPLSFRARPAAPMAARREPFRLSPLSGGMPGMIGGAPASRGLGAFAPGGTTSLGGMRRMPAGGGTSVMPRSIGYPFRQPPSLLAPSGGGMGPSM